MKCTGRMRNDELLRTGKKRGVMRIIKWRKTSRRRRVLRKSYPLPKVIQEIVEGKGNRDRTRFAMLTGVMERRSYLREI